MVIPGYTIETLLHESPRFMLFRAVRSSDGKRVVVKFPKLHSPTLSDLAGLYNEYTVLEGRSLEGIITPIEYISIGATAVLVREDVGAVSLKEFASGKPLDLKIFFEIAKKTASALASIHAASIIHKDLKPANILIHPEEHQIYYTDFSAASRLPYEARTLVAPAMLQGTFAYMSPEQTGRTSAVLDERTDLYSLGVSFYELLTGKLPFSAADALELLYAHIAQEPPPVTALRSNVPPMLSAILLKLLAKSPDERYQTADGLQADLERCRIETLSHKTTPFPLGEFDRRNRIHIPQRLYGRAVEQQTLLAMFEEVARGGEKSQGAQTLMLGGYSGIGKTRLVGEVFRPLTRTRGFYTSGKFDQLRTNTPYSAVIQALRHCVRQVLSMSDEEIRPYREHLAAALESNAPVLASVVPELAFLLDKHLLGEQPPMPDLPPVEQQNRFHRVVLQFLSVFARTEHPLVLFLDDMQWSDAASLRLLEDLFRSGLHEEPNKAFLLILAYRSNEAGSEHPFMMMMHTAETQATMPIRRIELTTLAHEAAGEMLQEMLGIKKKFLSENTPQHKNWRGFVDAIVVKTGGNPFFMQELLTALVKREVLCYVPQEQGWKWDTGAILAMNVTDNVADLVAERLQTLSKQTQKILALAAALGNVFEVRTLLALTDLRPSALAADLRTVLGEGLITLHNHDTAQTSTIYLPDEIDYKRDAAKGSKQLNERSNERSSAQAPNSSRSTFSFVHDRVQQAAYSLIPHYEKPALHRHIGRSLLHLVEEDEERLPEVVQHLGLGMIEFRGDGVYTLTAYKDDAERDVVMRLHARAAIRTRLANAYAQALEFAETALCQMPPDTWQRDYDFAFNLHLEYAQYLYLSGNLTAALKAFAHLKTRAVNDLYAARIVREEVIVKMNASLHTEIVAELPHLLHQLGVEFTNTPSRATIARELLRAERFLFGKTPEQLLALPLVTDQIKHIAQEILVETTGAFYSHGPEVSALIFMKVFTLGMQYGVSVMTGFAMTVFASIEANLLGRYKRALELAETGITMIERLNDRRALSRAVFNKYALTSFWLETASEGAPALRRTYAECLAAGDIVYAVYTTTQISDYEGFVGKPFASWLHELEAMTQFVRRVKYDAYLPHILCSVQYIRCLQGKTQSLDSFDDESFSERKFAATLGIGVSSATLTYYLRRMQALFLFGYYKLAEVYSEKIQEKFFAIQPLLNGTEYTFYRGMLSAARLRSEHLSDIEQKQHWKYLGSALKSFKTWSANCPQNFTCKYLLLQAEAASLGGKSGGTLLGGGRLGVAPGRNAAKAWNFYVAAVQEARQAGYAQHEALAAECATRFADRYRRTYEAQEYSAIAYQAYQKLGATAKLAQFFQEFSRFFEGMVLPPSADTALLAGQFSGQFSGQSLADKSLLENALLDSFSSSSSSQGQNTSALLDIMTVMKASQAISGEIVLTALLERMLRIVMANAGAQIAYFLVPSGQAAYETSSAAISTKPSEQFIIKARAEAASEQIVLPDAPLYHDESTPIAFAVVQYVARTQETVVLYNAEQSEQFLNDAHILRTKPRSVMCLPLVQQQKLSGILYMENNLTDGAFTEERVQLLQILATQMAVSFENALLYEQMEQKVVERTKELARANEELRHFNEQLRLLDQEKNELLGMVSHDLKNPIGAIILHSEMMQDEILGGLPSAYKSMVGDQLTTARRMEKILHNLLQMNALESGNVAINLQVFDPSSILQSMSEDYTTRAMAKEITLLYECHVSTLVNADEALLYQVFDNLISNALKYSPWKKRIWVKGVVRSVEGLGECFVACFQDEGEGISEQDMKRLFGKFARLSAQPTGNESSTGLGLSIVKKLVETMHGRVWCESQYGKGATFFVALPVHNSDEQL